MKLSDQNKEILRRFFAKRPVKRAFIFGSYARNDADEESDIDILVELDHASPIGMRFFTFQYELEDILHKKVDLVSDEGLSKYISPLVNKEKILIYERDND